MANASADRPRGRLLLTATVALLAGVVGSVGVAIAAHQFDDVPDGNFFHDSIGQIVEAGCATGFGDNTFRPGQGATRGQFSFWTANCGPRVTHERERVRAELGAGSETVTTPIVPPSANEQGFVLIMVDWSARPTIQEAGLAAAERDDGVQLVGAPPPCPCGVDAFHGVEQFGEGLVGRTSDVWPVNSGSGVDPYMVLSGSWTYVIPAGDEPVLDVTTRFLWVATEPAFAGSVDIDYSLTAVFLPFGWDGSQELTSTEG